MAIRTYKVTLDSKNTIAPEPVYLRQGDKTGAVVIDATLMDNGSPVSLNGLTPMFKANTADGQAVIADSTGFTVTDSVNGKFTYQVPNTLSATPGKITTAYFSLSDADGSESTFDVAFIIKAAVDITQKQADDYITIIDGTIKTLQEKIDAMNTDVQTILNAYKQGDFYNKSETDSKDASTLTSAKSYADFGDSAALTSAKSYTDNSLSGIVALPETFANLEAIKAKYPNGKNGLMVAADNGHKYIWANRTWTDAGVYQSVGIADGAVDSAKLSDGAVSKPKLDDDLSAVLDGVSEALGYHVNFPAAALYSRGDVKNITVTDLGNNAVNMAYAGSTDYAYLAKSLGKRLEIENATLVIRITNKTQNNLSLLYCINNIPSWANNPYRSDILISVGETFETSLELNSEIIGNFAETDDLFLLIGDDGKNPEVNVSFDSQATIQPKNSIYEVVNAFHAKSASEADKADHAGHANSADQASKADQAITAISAVSAGVIPLVMDPTTRGTVGVNANGLPMGHVRLTKGLTPDDPEDVHAVYFKIAFNDLTDLKGKLFLKLKNLGPEIPSGAQESNMDPLRLTAGVTDWGDIEKFKVINLDPENVTSLYDAINKAGFTDFYQQQKFVYLVVSTYDVNRGGNNKVFDYDFTAYMQATGNTVIATGMTDDLINNLKKYGNPTITCWGDSLTAMGGWTETLQSLSGMQLHNGGTGGEAVPTIVARQGADVMEINNVIIPAEMTPLTLATMSADGGIPTQFGKLATPLLQGGGGHVNPCYIGDVQGTLKWTGSSGSDNAGIWTFTRSVAGDAVTIKRPTALRTDFDINQNSPYLMIIFMGQNGGWDSPADLVRMHKLMLDHASAQHYLILGLHTGTAESRADYEAAMLDAFGRSFFSLRQYLAHPITDASGTITSCYGLDDAGMTPTADDLAKIDDGQVPLQLLADGTHYTDATKTVVGNAIYKYCCDLNIF